MKRTTILAAAGSGLLAAGLVAAAVPALAQGGPADTTQVRAGGQGYGGPNAERGTGDCTGGGQVAARGRAGAPNGTGAEDCATCTAEPGSGDPAALGSAGAADLVTWVEEEKVAFDLYTAFADLYDARQFERIAASEAKHMDAVRALLATYSLDDPTQGADAGEFTDPELAALYSTLLAQGQESLDEALAVGRAVELDDIDLLEQARDDVTAADVEAVLANQLAASQRHLAAFGG